MKLLINHQKINDLIQSFSEVTGFRIVLFDASFRQIACYPEQDCPFCTLIQNSPQGKKLCQRSNQEAFRFCARSDKMHLYQCHAGLYEAMVNLQSEGLIVGYLMFGQVSSIADQAKRREVLLPALKDSQANFAEKNRTIDALSFQAAAKLHNDSTILLALAKYAMSEQLLAYKKDNLMLLLNQYIDSHIEQEIYISDLATYFEISRSKLYVLFSHYLPSGLANYVEQRRLATAKRILQTSQDKISVIAGEVGFSDYTYFCRRFKKKFGLSPKSFRQQKK